MEKRRGSKNEGVEYTGRYTERPDREHALSMYSGQKKSESLRGGSR